MNLKFLDLKSQNQSIQEKIILSIKKISIIHHSLVEKI